MVWVFSSIISQVLLLCFIFYFLLPGFVSPPFFLLICVPVLLLHPFLLLFWTKAHPFGVPLSLVGRAGGPIPEALSLLQSLPLSLILLPITSSAILSKSHERPKKYQKKKKGTSIDACLPSPASDSTFSVLCNRNDLLFAHLIAPSHW